MADEKLFNKELGTILDNAIKKAFTLPFPVDEPYKSDVTAHGIPGTTFHLNGYLVVLHRIKLSPGLTFRAVEINTGDLNIFTQDVKFEIDIPAIGGSFYAVTEDKNVESPVHIEGTFQINYGTAIAKGITNYFLNYHFILGITNMTMDFEIVEKPRVALYFDEPEGSMGPFESDGTVNSAKVAEVLWQSLHPQFYRMLRKKIYQIVLKIPWNKRIPREQYIFHERNRRHKLSELLYDIITKIKISLRKKTNGGRLKMPDIDMIVASAHKPETRGKFKATYGWLGNVASVIANERTLGLFKINSNYEHLALHARSQNELVMVGQIKFNDWRYCYDEYTFETNNGNRTGEIIRNLYENEAFIVITATKTDEGKIIAKHGRFEYIDPPDITTDMTGVGNEDWLKEYVSSWMSGLMDAEKSNIKKLMNDCLNEALVDLDLFAYWTEFTKPKDIGRCADKVIKSVLQQ